MTKTTAKLMFAICLAASSAEVALSAPPALAQAEQDRDSAVRNHVRAFEQSAHSQDLARFDADVFDQSYIARTSRDQRAALIAQIAEAAREAGDITIDMEGDDFVLTLTGDASATRVIFDVAQTSPFAVTNLRVEQGGSAVQALSLSSENLDATIDDFASRGFAGVIYVRQNGAVVRERAFGDANRIDTVFGIGSRPIDFTIAAIAMLAHDGAIDLDAPITRYFANVPRDKRRITIRQILDDRSGFPNFVHTDSDWDADLAWISRDELERRVFASPLLFRPGSERRHSHAGYGVLAALVERVSGQSYPDFLRSRVFEPAGMARTGFYGDSHGLRLEDFAAGGGPALVGLPNIPPNWGPTSWLV
ncbi:MAG: beta-lactamase family protein, partial [Hyphomonadaceae bacterium]|nr:beta-lactamase family protein [Hyphomonadaceae bacterium]